MCFAPFSFLFSLLLVLVLISQFQLLQQSLQLSKENEQTQTPLQALGGAAAAGAGTDPPEGGGGSHMGGSQLLSHGLCLQVQFKLRRRRGLCRSLWKRNKCGIFHEAFQQVETLSRIEEEQL